LLRWIGVGCGGKVNGIQEVARSIRVSSTSKIKHYLVLGQHRTAALSENCPRMSSESVENSEAPCFLVRIFDRRRISANCPSRVPGRLKKLRVSAFERFKSQLCIEGERAPQNRI
jgi:hypothetical protein